MRNLISLIQDMLSSSGLDFMHFLNNSVSNTETLPPISIHAVMIALLVFSILTILRDLLGVPIPFAYISTSILSILGLDIECMPNVLEQTSLFDHQLILSLYLYSNNITADLGVFSFINLETLTSNTRLLFALDFLHYFIHYCSFSGLDTNISSLLSTFNQALLEVHSVLFEVGTDLGNSQNNVVLNYIVNHPRFLIGLALFISTALGIYYSSEIVNLYIQYYFFSYFISYFF